MNWNAVLALFCLGIAVFMYAGAVYAAFNAGGIGVALGFLLCLPFPLLVMIAVGK